MSDEKTTPPADKKTITVDFSAPLLALGGQPMKAPRYEDEPDANGNPKLLPLDKLPDMTLGDVCLTCCEQPPDKKDITRPKDQEAWQRSQNSLAERIFEGGRQELTAEEVVHLRTLILKLFSHPRTVTQALDRLG